MDGSEEDGTSLEREVFVSTSRAALTAFAAFVALLVAGAAELRGQAGRGETREGNRLYEEGRYPEAHEKYLEALLEAPDSPIIRFNDGNALYQGENYESALESFRAAVESGDPQLAAAAWYNLGNTLYRQGALPESLEAFKQALRADRRTSTPSTTSNAYSSRCSSNSNSSRGTARTNRKTNRRPRDSRRRRGENRTRRSSRTSRTRGTSQTRSRTRTTPSHRPRADLPRRGR